MIQGCVIFFQDGPQMLEKCLLSLKNCVDRILAIDGAYREFPHDKPWSTDGCLDIAKKYAHEVIETTEAWPDQATKRNAYFTLKSETDWYYILDTDEQHEGRIPDKLFGDCYKIRFDRWMDPVWLPGQYCRLIRHQKRIAYKYKHNMIFANRRMINNPDDDWPLLDTCRIIHRPSDRPVSRNEQDGEYLRNRKEEKYNYQQYTKGL